MRAALLYVNAGKGHYMPAKALADSLRRKGHDASVEDMFVVIGSRFWEWYCKYEWRFFLHHPGIERVVHRLADNKANAFLIRFLAVHTKLRKTFLAWYEQTRPDFIVCTNFLGGNVITPLVQHLGLGIPVFLYAADAFNNPTAGYNKKIDMFYIPTSLGRKLLLEKGQPADRVKVCPFPLQSKIAMQKPLSRTEARKRLGLADKFTVLLNFGGEGIGDTDFLEEVARRNLDWQIVAVGKLSRITSHKFAHFIERHPGFSLETPGFVDNIGEYICACDIQAGKAGANALMESLALGRPFLVSDLLYAARDTRTFLTTNNVGWVENNVRKQVDIVETYCNTPEEQEQMEHRFQFLELRFDSDAFSEMLLSDTRAFFGAGKSRNAQ
jgi:processive 1,2-diacylglycerol beta-glucosyltransferase